MMRKISFLALPLFIVLLFVYCDKDLTQDPVATDDGGGDSQDRVPDLVLSSDDFTVIAGEALGCDLQLQSIFGGLGSTCPGDRLVVVRMTGPLTAEDGLCLGEGTAEENVFPPVTDDPAFESRFESGGEILEDGLELRVYLDDPVDPDDNPFLADYTIRAGDLPGEIVYLQAYILCGGKGICSNPIDVRIVIDPDSAQSINLNAVPAALFPGDIVGPDNISTLTATVLDANNERRIVHSSLDGAVRLIEPNNTTGAGRLQIDDGYPAQAELGGHSVPPARSRQHRASVHYGDLPPIDLGIRHGLCGRLAAELTERLLWEPPERVHPNPADNYLRHSSTSIALLKNPFYLRPEGVPVSFLQ